MFNGYMLILDYDLQISSESLDDLKLLVERIGEYYKHITLLRYSNGTIKYAKI